MKKAHSFKLEIAESKVSLNSVTVWVRFALSGRLKLLSLPTPSPA